jgi:hypothetical protein
MSLGLLFLSKNSSLQMYIDVINHTLSFLLTDRWTAHVRAEIGQVCIYEAEKKQVSINR